ncbi:hypothetical protein ACW4TU_44260 [Streptomyces sp. QTS52]
MPHVLVVVQAGGVAGHDLDLDLVRTGRSGNQALFLARHASA